MVADHACVGMGRRGEVNPGRGHVTRGGAEEGGAGAVMVWRTLARDQVRGQRDVYSRYMCTGWGSCRDGNCLSFSLSLCLSVCLSVCLTFPPRPFKIKMNASHVQAEFT